MADGNIVYQGDAKASVSYFKHAGRPAPALCNPADFFMKLLSVSYPIESEDKKKLGDLN